MTSQPLTADTATQALPLNLFRGVRDRAAAKRMRKELELIEAGLTEHLQFASPVADAPARYLLEAGGKRIRPALTVLASWLGDGPDERVRTAAMAVEMTHLASLYHDDVMDDARLRRGVPAAQTVWSNSVAILAGDLLFARASGLVSGMGEAAIKLQAQTFERLCLGQLHETVGPEPGEEPIAHYLTVLADKTGALIASAARLGAMLSGAPGDYFEPIAHYGERIGVAFQLVDDVIDLSAREELTGKRAGTDLRAGVATLPMLLLRQRAAQSGEQAANDAALVSRIDDGVAAIASGADTSVLDAAVAQLRDHEVTAETHETARRWAADAVRALEPLPDSDVKRALGAMAEAIVDREA